MSETVDLYIECVHVVYIMCSLIELKTMMIFICSCRNNNHPEAVELDIGSKCVCDTMRRMCSLTRISSLNVPEAVELDIGGRYP